MSQCVPRAENLHHTRVDKGRSRLESLSNKLLIPAFITNNRFMLDRHDSALLHLLLRSFRIDSWPPILFSFSLRGIFVEPRAWNAIFAEFFFRLVFLLIRLSSWQCLPLFFSSNLCSFYRTFWLCMFNCGILSLFCSER